MTKASTTITWTALYYGAGNCFGLEFVQVRILLLCSVGNCSRVWAPKQPGCGTAQGTGFSSPAQSLSHQTLPFLPAKLIVRSAAADAPDVGFCLRAV